MVTVSSEQAYLIFDLNHKNSMMFVMLLQPRHHADKSLTILRYRFYAKWRNGGCLTSVREPRPEKATTILLDPLGDVIAFAIFP